MPGVLLRSQPDRFTPAVLAPADELPWPRYDFVALDNYRYPGAPGNAVHVNMARGCYWGRCEFCQSARITPGYRGRRFQDVLAELDWLYGHGVRQIYFSDLAFGREHGPYREFLRALAGRLPGLVFSGQMRFVRELDAELFRLMRQAGFTWMSFGLESGSPKVLQRLCKGFTVAIAAQCLRDCHAAGIATALFLIAGHPEEGEAEFQETCRFLAAHREFITRVEQVCLYEFQFGTPAYDRLPAYQAELGLRYPPDAGENGNVFLWEIPGSNTLATRIRRQQELYRLAAELGLGKGHYSQQEDGNVVVAPPLATRIVRWLEKSRWRWLLAGYRRVKRLLRRQGDGC